MFVCFANCASFLQTIDQNASPSHTQNHRLIDEQKIYGYPPTHTHTACWCPFIALISQYHQRASLVLRSPGTKMLHSQPKPPPPSLGNFLLAELAAAINDLICDLSLCSWDCKCSYSIWGKGLGCPRPPKQAATQGCNFTLSLSH